MADAAWSGAALAAGSGGALARAFDEAAASQDSQATLQLAGAAGASVPEDAELMDAIAKDLGLEGAAAAGDGAAEAEAPKEEEGAAEEGEEAADGGPMRRPAAASRKKREPKKVRAKYAGPKGPPPKAKAKVDAKAVAKADAKEKAMAVAAAKDAARTAAPAAPSKKAPQPKAPSKKAQPKFADILKWMAQPTPRAKASGGVPTLRLGESVPSPKDGDGALQVGKAKAKGTAMAQALSSPPSRPRRCTSDTESQASGMGEEPKAGSSPKFRVGSFAALSSPGKRAAPLSLEAVENEFLCDRCDQPCDVMKAYPVRMTKKGQVYRCALCSTRGVQANRAPAWKEMASKLKDFSIEERAEFWSKIRACNGQAGVKAMVQETLKAIHEKGTRAGKKGGYYPLSWYKRQGFPWKRIKKTCTDTLNHAVMGLCYKVDIHEIEKWEANIARREKEYGASRAAEAEDGLEASGSDDREPCIQKKPAASAQAGAEGADESAEDGDEESVEDPDSTDDEIDGTDEDSEQLQGGSDDSDSFGLDTSDEDSMGDGDGSYGGQPPPVTPSGGSDDESSDDGTPPPKNKKSDKDKEKSKGKSSKDKEKSKDKDKDKDKSKSKAADKDKDKDKDKGKSKTKDTDKDKDNNKDNDKSKSNGKDKDNDNDKDKDKDKAKSKGADKDNDAGEGKDTDNSKGKYNDKDKGKDKDNDNEASKIKGKYKDNEKDKDKKANNDKSKSNGPDKDKGKHKATKKDKDKADGKADDKDKSKGKKKDKDKSNGKADGKTKGKKRANEGAAESSTKKMKKQKPTTSSSQSGSDSDSGSPSPAHPRVGETDKERAAREKQEKKEQSKKDKEEQQQKLLATRTLSRIVAPLYKLETALKCDGVGKIPEATLGHAKKLMDTLTKMKKVADKVSSGKVAPSEFTWSAQEVTDMSTQAAAQSTLVMSMAKAYLVTAKSS